MTGPMAQVRNPMLYGVPINADDAPPLNGEHTVDLLSELGYDEERIAELRAEGTVAVWTRPAPPEHAGEISVV